MRILIEADWVVTPELQAVRNGFIVVEKGSIRELLKRRPEGRFDRLVKLEGILYHPIVNAHTHLKLSQEKFYPESNKDFFEWLLFIIGKRSTFTEQDVKEAVEKGARELL